VARLTRAELLVATRNPAKAAELNDIVSALGFAVTTLDAIALPASSDEDDQLETHDTFAANALAKARYYHALSGGCPTVADDSGLEVDALGGAPGVRSRRWAGAVGGEREVSAANNAALLARLHGLADRAARFVCAVAYVDASHSVTCSGYVIGRIANESRGNAGFGYDPVFEPDELGGRTFGEASPAEKASISHRVRALAALGQELNRRGISGR
jgi:XTP/dITP diphosphohydrolase